MYLSIVCLSGDMTTRAIDSGWCHTTFMTCDFCLILLTEVSHQVQPTWDGTGLHKGIKSGDEAIWHFKTGTTGIVVPHLGSTGFSWWWWGGNYKKWSYGKAQILMVKRALIVCRFWLFSFRISMPILIICAQVFQPLNYSLREFLL